GEKSARDKNSSRCLDLGRDRGPCRNLVVERREGEAGIRRLYQHTAQDRKRRALRKKLDRKGDCFAEDIAIDVELHNHLCRERARRESVGLNSGTAARTVLLLEVSNRTPDELRD